MAQQLGQLISQDKQIPPAGKREFSTLSNSKYVIWVWVGDPLCKMCDIDAERE